MTAYGSFFWQKFPTCQQSCQILFEKSPTPSSPACVSKKKLPNQKRIIIPNQKKQNPPGPPWSAHPLVRLVLWSHWSSGPWCFGAMSSAPSPRALLVLSDSAPFRSSWSVGCVLSYTSNSTIQSVLYNSPPPQPLSSFFSNISIYPKSLYVYLRISWFAFILHKQF